MDPKDKSEANYKGVFDLSDAEGVNASERLLTKLCRRSFLSLWANPNLHTDEGFRNGAGAAKEFTDVLMVFGDDVILFSDKHVEFNQNKPLEVSWPRWYRRAVSHSAKQLYGALSWIKRFPQRIFLDSKCTRALPIELPSPDRARYHLVAVTRGSFEACSKHFPGSLGTLLIQSDLEGDAHEKAPFTVGILDRSKPFVHVFDEFSLEFLLTELDTATDFVDYLIARERFLSDQSKLVHATGEEQLAAAYLLTMDGNKH